MTPVVGVRIQNESDQEPPHKLRRRLLFATFVFSKYSIHYRLEKGRIIYLFRIVGPPGLHGTSQPERSISQIRCMSDTFPRVPHILGSLGSHKMDIVQLLA